MELKLKSNCSLRGHRDPALARGSIFIDDFKPIQVELVIFEFIEVIESQCVVSVGVFDPELDWILPFIVHLELGSIHAVGPQKREVNIGCEQPQIGILHAALYAYHF